MAVSVTTNGTLISDEIADLWQTRRPSKIKISFYGWDDSSYETVVGRRGAFQLFTSGLTRLAVRGIPFSMLVPAHPMLLPELGKLHDLGVRYGARGTVSVGWELMLHSRHDETANSCIKCLRPPPSEAARQKMQFPDVVYADIQSIRKGGSPSAPADRLLFRCAAGDQTLAIDSRGLLHPCRPLFNSLLAYDLTRGSLRGAVEEHMPAIRAMTIDEGSLLERCTRCSLRPACLSCPATSWMENRSLDTPVEYHCQAIHQEAYWLGLLRPGEKGWNPRGADARIGQPHDGINDVTTR